MEEIQEKHERWVGDTFVRLCTQYCGYHFKCRGGEAPDLIYHDCGGNEVNLEIVTAYYDRADAKSRWLGARQRQDAPTSWSGVDFSDALIGNINSAISAKCKKAYGPRCVLLVCIIPPLSLAHDIQHRRPNIVIPAGHSFHSIYLIGSFGATVRRSAEECLWRLDS